MEKPLTLQGVPERGTFVVAVSGGVDSMVLLHLLREQRPHARIIVAHVEHGIRGESSRGDAAFVIETAARLGYQCEVLNAGLGAEAGEAEARQVRYEFFARVSSDYGATALMTAHHADDVLETLILNLQRGTGWRGLCSLRSTERLLRPLLPFSKLEITTYASSHGVQWREDETNQTDTYARNRVRHTIIPKLDPSARDRLLRLAAEQAKLREQIEAEAAEALRRATVFRHADWMELHRYFIVSLPLEVALELLHTAALDVSSRSLLRHQAEQLRLFVAAGQPGHILQPGGGLCARATRRGVVVGLR